MLPEGAAPSQEEKSDLLDAVMRLPLALRQVILLTYYEDMSPEMAAQTLQISRASYYRRLNKARGMLRINAERWYSNA